MADDQLSGRELDREVARKVIKLPESLISINGPIGRDGHPVREIEYYSSDMEAAMQVEDRIAELGLQNDYIAHLWIAVGATRRNGVNFWTADNFKAFWLCVHATAEQRCRAALAAIGDKD